MKTLLVTGASRGVGFEICNQAASAGNMVIALSRNITSLEGIQNIYPFSVDLSKCSALEDFVKQIKNSFRSIDVLINNAGNLLNKPFLETSSSEFEEVYKVNVSGAATLTRLLLPIISSNGHVLNITSWEVYRGAPSSRACRPTAVVREHL